MEEYFHRLKRMHQVVAFSAAMCGLQSILLLRFESVVGHFHTKNLIMYVMFILSDQHATIIKMYDFCVEVLSF